MSREQPEATRTHYSVCWTEGYDDHVADYALSECPYERGSDSYAFWTEGWRDAETDEGSGEPEITDAELGEIEQFVGLYPASTFYQARILKALRAYRQKAKAKDVALRAIRDHEGKVCAEYEICTHPASASSYHSWAIADAALYNLPSVAKQGKD